MAKAFIESRISRKLKILVTTSSLLLPPIINRIDHRCVLARYIGAFNMVGAVRQVCGVAGVPRIRRQGEREYSYRDINSDSAS